MSVFERQVNIPVIVHPNAARNELVGFANDVFHVKVSVPPVKGRANKELIAFLSQILDINRSSVSIMKGQTSRNKVIAVQGLSREEVMKRLSQTES